MSSVDEILYSPVNIQQSWRQLCRDIVDYITTQGPILKPMKDLFPLDRVRPTGSLFLEELMERYHVYGQRRFFLVIGTVHTRQIETFDFDGQLVFAHYDKGGAPRLGCRTDRSIRDLNLVKNTYNRNYVFAIDHEARAYFNSL